MPDGKEPPRCVCLKATHEGIPVVVHVTSARDFATLENLKLFSEMHHKLLQLFVDVGLCVKQVGTPVVSHRAGPVSPDQARVSPSRLAAIRHVRASGHRKLLVGVALRTLFHAERAFQKHTQEFCRPRRDLVGTSSSTLVLCVLHLENTILAICPVPRSPRGVIVNARSRETSFASVFTETSCRCLIENFGPHLADAFISIRSGDFVVHVAISSTCHRRLWLSVCSNRRTRPWSRDFLITIMITCVAWCHRPVQVFFHWSGKHLDCGNERQRGLLHGTSGTRTEVRNRIAEVDCGAVVIATGHAEATQTK